MSHRNMTGATVSPEGTPWCRQPWIVIPRDDIKVLGQLHIVHVREQPHQVMSNSVLGAEIAQDLHLELLILNPTLRSETCEIQVERGIIRRSSASRPHVSHRNGNLFPCGVFLAPKNGTPQSVEAFETSVALPQPCLKSCAARGTVTAYTIGNVAHLVVYLPGEYCGVLLVMPCHRLDNTACRRVERRLRGAVMASHTETCSLSAFINR